MGVVHVGRGVKRVVHIGRGVDRVLPIGRVRGVHVGAVGEACFGPLHAVLLGGYESRGDAIGRGPLDQSVSYVRVERSARQD
jgi:hypothetical protein